MVGQHKYDSWDKSVGWKVAPLPLPPPPRSQQNHLVISPHYPEGREEGGGRKEEERKSPSVFPSFLALCCHLSTQASSVVFPSLFPLLPFPPSPIPLCASNAAILPSPPRLDLVVGWRRGEGRGTQRRTTVHRLLLLLPRLQPLEPLSFFLSFLASAWAGEPREGRESGGGVVEGL